LAASSVFPFEVRLRDQLAPLAAFATGLYAPSNSSVSVDPPHRHSLGQNPGQKALPFLHFLDLVLGVQRFRDLPHVCMF
jgi:hypothetical protein